LHSVKNKDGALVPNLTAVMRSGGESVYLARKAAVRGLTDAPLQMLRDLSGAGGKASGRWGDTLDLHRNTKHRCRKSLLERGLVEEDPASGTVRITEAGEAEL
jgi:hypothetical protein